ncbi:MAG: hypothetical protein KGJ59_06575 [Bacteroidota bacterium]|nr:hypothetical protein [Bacteroidota bacterium]
MNPLGRRTVQLARTKNYLDRLYNVYPNEISSRRVDEDLLKEVQRLFQENRSVELLQTLLDLEKFPIKDSYVSF